MTKSNLNIEELLQQFDAENARKLGEAAGLSSDIAERLLERGVRTQLETLAAHARLEAGQRQILDAIDQLPQFGTVERGLTEQGGASSLMIAGEILSPALLGQDQSEMAGQLSRIEGASKDSIQNLLNMSLPLLLSFMGERGLNRSTITEVMSGIRSGGLRPRSLGGSYVSRAAQQAQQAQQNADKGDAAKKAKAQAGPAPKPERPAKPASDAAQADKLQEGDRPEPPRTNGREPSHSTDIGPGLEPPTPPVGKTAPAKPEANGPVKTEPPASKADDQRGAEPEQADDDYSKDSVISTLLDDEAVAETVKELDKAGSEKDNKSTTKGSAGKEAVADAGKTVGSTISNGPAAPRTSGANATKPADTSAMTEPAKPQPTAGAAAVAAAAAAAGVGAGVAASKSTVQPKETGQTSQQTTKPAAQGSPWKSPKPMVMGAQPSPTVKKSAGPTAVPVSPAKPAAPATASAKPATKPATPPTAASAAALGVAGLSAAGLIEAFRTQFLRSEAGALAEATGFTKGDSARAVRATVPVVLSAASQKAASPEGAAELMKLAEGHTRVTKADGTLDMEVLGRRADLGALEVRGISELGQLMDNPAEVSGRLGTALGVSGEQAGRLLALMAPVVLGLLGRQAAGASAADLSRVLGDVRPRLEALLPEGMGVMKALLGQTLYGAAPKQRTTLLETKQAKATAAAGAAGVAGTAAAAVVDKQKPAVAPMQPEPTKPVTPPPPPPREPERGGGGFPWWILLVLALLAGLAWYFSSQNQSAPVPEVEPAVTQPAEQVEEPAVSEADIEGAPGTESEEIVPAEDDIALGTAAGEGVLAVLTPEEGQSVPDTGFDMSGTGVAGATYQLFEDGISVGTFTADDTGLWQVDVAAPAAGDHTYTVRDADGNEVLSRAITVDVTAAAECSEPMSLSLSDGENVNAPFRFGGAGDASGYQVRVLRGEEEIGTKDILLASNCTWNYLSQPGGDAGTQEAITYEVRSLDDLEAEPLQSITLNVLQAGE